MLKYCKHDWAKRLLEFGHQHSEPAVLGALLPIVAELYPTKVPGVDYYDTIRTYTANTWFLRTALDAMADRNQEALDAFSRFESQEWFCWEWVVPGSIPWERLTVLYRSPIVSVDESYDTVYQNVTCDTFQLCDIVLNRMDFK